MFLPHSSFGASKVTATDSTAAVTAKNNAAAAAQASRDADHAAAVEQDRRDAAKAQAERAKQAADEARVEQKAAAEVKAQQIRDEEARQVAAQRAQSDAAMKKSQQDLQNHVDDMNASIRTAVDRSRGGSNGMGTASHPIPPNPTVITPAVSPDTSSTPDAVSAPFPSGAADASATATPPQTDVGVSRTNYVESQRQQAAIAEAARQQAQAARADDVARTAENAELFAQVVGNGGMRQPSPFGNQVASDESVSGWRDVADKATELGKFGLEQSWEAVKGVGEQAAKHAVESKLPATVVETGFGALDVGLYMLDSTPTASPEDDERDLVADLRRAKDAQEVQLQIRTDPAKKALFDEFNRRMNAIDQAIPLPVNLPTPASVGPAQTP